MAPRPRQTTPAGVDPAFLEYLHELARRWATVDAAIRAAHHDEDFPPGAPAIDYSSMAITVRSYTKRELTVRSTGQGATRTRTREWLDRAHDRAQVLAVLAQLDVVDRFIVVRYAHRDSYRAIARKLRERGMAIGDHALPRRHRKAREHVAERLEACGLVGAP